MPAQNASPSPVMSTARTCGSARNSRTASMMPSRIADRQRVLRLGPVEHDAADAVGVALDAQVGLGHDASFRFVRMLTTATPEPRPPALCCSA